MHPHALRQLVAAACWLCLASVQAAIVVNTSQRLEVIDNVGEVLCRSQLKVLYVYFENETSLSYSQRLLHHVTDCGISYISFRNKFKKAPLEAIRDDGILMYLVSIMVDVSQPLALSIIKKKSGAKHLSHIFLLIEDGKSVTETWLYAAFKEFWKIWFLNIVIIFWRDDHLQIYRYNPFNNNYLIKVDYGAKLPQLSDLFPKTIPNMQRKPLRMCIFPDDIRAIFGGAGILGTDGLMSGYIAQRINATRVVDRVEPFERTNSLADICFDEVANEYDDISLNIRFLAPDVFYRQAETTVAHNRDDLCVIVPKAKVASTFWNLFRSFGGTVWFLILLSMLLANTFCFLVSQGHYIMQRMMLQLFACTLTQPLTHMPRQNPLRLFLIFFLFFSMLICTAFRGNLTSMLVSNKNLPDINTIRDLALSPYPILVRLRHMKQIQRFLNDEQLHEAILKQKMLIVSDEELLEYFDNNNLSFAYLEKFHVASFQTNARRHMEYGRPLFHLMSTCLVPFHAVYIVPFGSPYLGIFNTLIRSAYEFGFETYWDHIMNTAFIKSGTTALTKRKGSAEEPVVLQLHHFLAVFGLWQLGILLAIAVFLWEVAGKRLAALCKRAQDNKRQATGRAGRQANRRRGRHARIINYN